MARGSVRKSKDKIFSVALLAKRLSGNIRSQNKTVFTNGCFDILHPGHVSLLERARLKGDRLIVALNTDRSVSRIKGPKRPINCLKDRLQVIASLECVDYVTWFDEATPLEAIIKICPFVLVKGGDWKPSQIIGAAEVKSWGGQVYSLSLIQGKSTTGLVKKISQL